MYRTKSFGPALLAAVLTLASTAQATGLSRAPYLQKVGQDSALVAFRLDANCTPEVHYGTDGALNEVARSMASGRIHAVTLKGLTAGTEYTYVVDACGTRTEPKRFRTAPTPETRRVHFAAVGDMGTNSSTQKKVARSVLAARPELYLTLGDNAYPNGTDSEFQKHFFEPMADLLSEVAMFTSPGNHEYLTQQAQPYLDNLYLPTNNPQGSERYYSFDWGHVHFVSLDSNCAIGLASSDLCTLKEMKAWAERDLAASEQPWKLVFFHHPPWSSGAHGSQLKMRREFAPLFEEHGVDLVLTGHDHNYERTKPMKGEGVAPEGTRGVTYLVVGSGGAALRDWPGSAPSWSAVRNNKDYGYLDVKIEDGTLTARMVSPTGEVFDSFTLTKKPSPSGQRPEHAPSPTVEPEPPAEEPAPPQLPAPPLSGAPSATVEPPKTGCSTAPLAALLSLSLVGLVSQRRRRRKQADRH